MKKYLYLFFVALFATMSFSLTSCGDDDKDPNEPNGGQTTSTLTINGKKVAFDSYFTQLLDRYDGRKMFWCQISGDGSLDVNLDNWESLTNGYAYSSNNEDIAIAYYTNESDYPCGHEIYGFSSGSVKVVKIDEANNTVSLSFNKAVFNCNQDNTIITIDGTLIMPIEGRSYLD